MNLSARIVARRVVVALALICALATASSADQKTIHVKGYTKKDGTYVKPHDRKAPGSSDSSTASPPAPKKETTPSVSHASATVHNPNRCEDCDRDSHGRIVRSKDAKKAFMKATGFPHGRPGYVIDHVLPLACGGADLPSNMQWQTVTEARSKDKIERASCR